MTWLLANWKLVLGLLVGLGLFLAGWHARGVQAARDLDALKLSYSQAVAKQQAANLVSEDQYVKQLQAASVQHDQDLSTLAAIRALPVPHLVCHAVSRRTPVSGLPTSSGASPSSPRVLPEPSPQSFDPSPTVLALADSADDAVEACRAAFARWPTLH
jgi:hypothetical protein